MVKACNNLPFDDFNSFSQEKCFELFSKSEKKVETTPMDELILQILCVSLQNYFSKMTQKNLQDFSHCFILTQMVWARIVESKKDTESLGLLVNLVSVFLTKLDEFILDEKNKEEGKI